MLSADKVKAIRTKAEILAGQSLGENGDLLAEMAAQRACAYCRREDIPEEMEQAVAVLTAVMGGLDAGDGVKTIQRGDTSITYDTTKKPAKAVESLLAPFCRLGRVRR